MGAGQCAQHRTGITAALPRDLQAHAAGPGSSLTCAGTVPDAGTSGRGSQLSSLPPNPCPSMLSACGLRMYVRQPRGRRPAPMPPADRGSWPSPDYGDKRPATHRAPNSPVPAPPTPTRQTSRPGRGVERRVHCPGYRRHRGARCTRNPRERHAAAVLAPPIPACSPSTVSADPHPLFGRHHRWLRATTGTA
jgi:hypothetical protein